MAKDLLANLWYIGFGPVIRACLEGVFEMSDANGSAVGLVASLTGHATVNHQDGTHQDIVKGMPVYQGDTITTDANGGVNITFKDGTVFAVSNDAEMTIDEFVYDPNKHGEGDADVSVVRGIFLYTSGLIGKEDPTDVNIKTPVGSIGIRGTILTGFIPDHGDSHPPTVSLIEGKIVVTPNKGEPITLDETAETVVLNADGTAAHNIGVIDPEGMLKTYNVVRTVAPELFEPVVNMLGTPHSQQIPVPGEDGNGHIPDATVKTSEALPEGESSTSTDTAGSDPTSGTSPDTSGTTATTTDANTSDGTSITDTVSTTDTSLSGDTGTTLDGTNTLSLSDGTTTSLSDTSLLGTSPTSTSTTTATSPLTPVISTDPLIGGTTNSGGTLPTGSTSTGSTGTVFYVPNHAPIANLTAHTFLEQGIISGTIERFGIKQFFSDPDGNALSYNVVGVNGDVSQVSFSTDGYIYVQASAGMASSGMGSVYIQATDGLLNSTTTRFDFNLFKFVAGSITGTNLNNSGTETTPGATYSLLGGDDSLNVTSSNSAIFGGIGDDIIRLFGSNNRAYGEEGNDTLQIMTGSGGGHLISGGAGNDFLSYLPSVASNGNMMFGGDGNDMIKVNSFSIAKLGSGDLLIDAGAGFDTLYLDGGSSINLSGISANQIHTIEKVQGTSGSTVTLSVEDIIQHSGAGFLFIADASSVTLNGSGAAPLSQIGSNQSNPYQADGMTYDVFSNGKQTLYIETGTTHMGSGFV